MKDYILKNKGFCFSLGGGLLAYLLVYAILVSPLQSEAQDAVRQAEGLRGRLNGIFSGGDYRSEGDIRRAAEEAEALHQEIEELKERMQLNVHPDYEMPRGGGGSTALFREKLNTAERFLKERARLQDVAMLDDLGISASEEKEPDYSVLATQLDMVRHALALAIDAGVVRLLEAGTGHRTVDPRRRGRRAAKDELPETPGIGRTTAHVKVEGSMESVTRLLHGLQKVGHFYSIITVELDNKSPDDENLTATVIFAGMNIDLEAEVALEEVADDELDVIELDGTGDDYPWR